MNWFFFALITPLVHSVANFVDKVLLSKYFKTFNSFVFLIYATATTLVALPIFAFLGETSVLQVSFYDILLLMTAGVCSAGAIYFYLFALYREDTSVIVPFFQLVPVFSFILGWMILGETLTSWQLVGSLVVILGAAILSVEIEEGRKIRFRHYVVLSMIAMSILIALSGILFKFVAIGNDFWLSNFWESAGFILVGIIIFLTRKKDREEFFDSIKIHKSKIALSVLLSEIFTLGGNLSLNYAFLIAPVALVRVVEGYQPIFVLIIGLIITKMFPRILQEKMHWKHLLPKVLAILIIFVGSYIVLR